jgi:hypothetical protein
VLQEAPPKLLDTLHMIVDLSSWDVVDALEAAIPERHPAWLEDCLSPADAVAEVWFRYAHVVEREYGRQQLQRPRKFEYFQTLSETQVSAQPVTAADIELLSSRLEREYAARRRGHGARLLEFIDDDAWSFVIWHGESLRQDLHWDDGTVRRIDYRPVGVDIVAYQPAWRELRISARAEWQKQLYREAFGRVLFGDGQAFPGAMKFTLDPLLQDRRAAVNCVDLPGIERVKLIEMEVMYSDGFKVKFLASDMVDDARGTPPPSTRIIGATFEVKLRGHRAPRKVEIRPYNIAKYDRDAASVWIDRWLLLRGFVLTRKRHDDESQPLLAVA